MLVEIIAAVVYIIVAAALTFQVTESVGDFFFVLLMVLPSLIPLFALEYTLRLWLFLKKKLTHSKRMIQ